MLVGARFAKLAWIEAIFGIDRAMATLLPHKIGIVNSLSLRNMPLLIHVDALGHEKNCNLEIVFVEMLRNSLYRLERRFCR